MSSKIRDRFQSDQGFTLIELLVVILIIGILAAIAVPAFLNQQQKAQDGNAKTNAVSGRDAMETCNTDNNPNTYVGCTPAALRAIEPNLQNANGLATAGLAAATYQVTVTSDSGTTFTMARAANGAITRTCSAAGTGGCRAANAQGQMW